MTKLSFELRRPVCARLRQFMAFDRRAWVIVAVVVAAILAMFADDMNEWLHRPTAVNNPQTNFARDFDQTSDRRLKDGVTGHEATARGPDHGTRQTKDRQSAAEPDAAARAQTLSKSAAETRHDGASADPDASAVLAPAQDQQVKVEAPLDARAADAAARPNDAQPLDQTATLPNQRGDSRAADGRSGSELTHEHARPQGNATAETAKSSIDDAVDGGAADAAAQIG